MISSPTLVSINIGWFYEETEVPKSHSCEYRFPETEDRTLHSTSKTCRTILFKAPYQLVNYKAFLLKSILTTAQCGKHFISFTQKTVQPELMSLSNSVSRSMWCFHWSHTKDLGTCLLSAARLQSSAVST